ncbi:predicted protein [Sclerotinia sclerotiorum 1980 UF-70]|uniref:Uncharacterized protein n=1 Tax=Sclerotinia sclerotiorum (strain ATCC 18683 / 1980 / Ss-1) TaxID=665079 RepID=A7ENF8_SCLS1|nr:predicted protein [Sclerotinia sclerotiorum 1980 UF-70]EDO04374.1 predicted protein [Sclerotinia sclerotiorum 1980 UF-70]
MANLYLALFNLRGGVNLSAPLFRKIKGLPDPPNVLHWRQI